MKKITASHVMLYVALFIYIAVILTGIIFLKHCADVGDMESAKTTFVSLISGSAVCGSTVWGFYSNKAAKENVLQISNAKYRMRLDLAKDIYKEFQGATLDEKSVQFMRTLISDENVTVDTSNYIPNNIPAEINVDNTSISFNDNSSEGLG